MKILNMVLIFKIFGRKNAFDFTYQTQFPHPPFFLPFPFPLPIHYPLFRVGKAFLGESTKSGIPIRVKDKPTTLPTYKGWVRYPTIGSGSKKQVRPPGTGLLPLSSPLSRNRSNHIVVTHVKSLFWSYVDSPVVSPYSMKLAPTSSGQLSHFLELPASLQISSRNSDQYLVVGQCICFH